MSGSTYRVADNASASSHIKSMQTNKYFDTNHNMSITEDFLSNKCSVDSKILFIRWNLFFVFLISLIKWLSLSECMYVEYVNCIELKLTSDCLNIEQSVGSLVQYLPVYIPSYKKYLGFKNWNFLSNSKDPWFMKMFLMLPGL